MSGQPDDLTAFTRALANVPPHQGLLNRDALLFAAGRASARRGPFWPALAGTLGVLSAALLVILLVRPASVVEVERIVYVPTPVGVEPIPTDPAPPAEDYPTPVESPATPVWVGGSRLGQDVLHLGATAPPSWAPPSSDAPNLSDLRLNASHLNRGPIQ
jgi:hypothetical protein